MSHPAIKESDIVKTITDWLTVHKLFWWRNNTGAFTASYKGKPRFVRFGKTGSADIFVVRRDGDLTSRDSGPCGTEIFGIEVKGPKGEQSQVQRDWQTEFERVFLTTGH